MAGCRTSEALLKTPEAGRFGVSPDHPGRVTKVTVRVEVEEGQGEPVLIDRIRRKYIVILVYR